ncbi:MAG: hypothetical protein WBL25_11350 [Anaerolineales bacterium]
MAKKSNNQQDDQQRDDEFVDLPEDRLDQIGQETPKEEKPEKKPEGNDTAPRKPEQDQVRDEAEKEVVEESESAREDLLADVRRSLAQDEEEVEQPRGFFDRIRQLLGMSSEPKTEEIEPQVQLEIEPEVQEDLQEDLQEVLDKLTVKPESEPEPKPKPKKKRAENNKQEEKAVQEFFADLEALADIVPDEDIQQEIEEQERAVEVPQVDEEVKVPKLPVKSKAEDEVDFEAVREVALEEYDETRTEPEERRAPLREVVRQTIRELRPVERFLLIGFGVVTIGVLFFSGIYIIANSISIPAPTPTVEVDISEIVHPTRLTLPGGWEFNLGQGRVSEQGEWTPNGAEWLVGTEISRWVALPWSLQLEAVLRTLKSDDQIELMMSNFDVLTFNVYSIQEITMEAILATDPTTPGLLVVLYNDEEADGKFWVVTGLPARDE